MLIFVTSLLLGSSMTFSLSNLDLIFKDQIKGNDPTQTNSLDTAKIQVPFIQNQGQLNSDVKFYANTFAGTIFVTDDGLTYSIVNDKKIHNHHEAPLGNLAIKETFVSDYIINPQGLEKSKTVVNYFKGKQENWRTNIPSYDILSLGTVWPSIDVELKAHGNNVEKIFKVNPGGNVEDIKLQLDGITKLSANGKGELVLATADGPISLSKPVAFQYINGEKKLVDVSYTIGDKTYGFVAEKYDKSQPLVIDPLLASTYLGGSNSDSDARLLITPDNVYLAGRTFSSGLGTTGAYDNALAGSHDLFVAKLNSQLTSLQVLTYLGGTGGATPLSQVEFISDIVLDSSGNVYVGGSTRASDFPTTSGAFDRVFSGSDSVSEGFISKLNGDLTHLLASTYFGNTIANISHMLLDSSGNLYGFGSASSSAFTPTTGAFDTTFGGTSEGLIVKFNGELTQLLASTFIGGDGTDSADFAIFDSSGNFYVFGNTRSTDLATAGTYQTTNAGNGDVFIARVNSQLTSNPVITFLGGGGNELVQGQVMALDSSGNVYIATDSDGASYPTTVGAYDRDFGGGTFSDTAVSKLNGDLTQLLASTFIGGTSSDTPRSLKIDGSGNVYVGGATRSSGFPTTSGAHDTTFVSSEGFIVKFNGELTQLLASTFIGGTGGDGVTRIAFDSSGSLYVTGITTSSDFTTTGGAYDIDFSGVTDYFVSRICSNLSETCAPSIPPGLIVKPGNGQVTIQWTSPPSSGGTITGYTVQKNTTNAGTSFTNIAAGDVTISGSVTSATSLTVSNLENGKTYLLRIIVTNSAGSSTPSNIIVVKPTANANSNFQFVAPPSSMSTADRTMMTSKGLSSDFVMPSPVIVSTSNFNPFDSSFTQKLEFTTKASKDTSLSTLIENYAIQQYSKPSSWSTSTVWSIPPSIVPVTGDIGQSAIFRMNQLEPQKPVYLPFTDADALSNGAKLGGVRFAMASGTTSDNVNVNSEFLSEPPTGVPAFSGAQMYMSFDLSTTTSGVSFDSASTFSTAPTVSFTQGPVENQVNDPTTPTNTVNSEITCPKVDVFLVSGSSASSSGISVSRDTSGDTSSVCGYTATLQHFSNYFSSVSTSSSEASSGGSPKGDVSPPAFSGSVFSDSEYPLSIDGASFKLSYYSNTIPTQIRETGKPITLNFLAFENSGNEIEHLAIYTNLRSLTREISHSDTYMIYEKGKDLQVFDPNGYFSDVKVTTEKKQDKQEFSFQITFAKPMEKSDIIVRMWDDRRNSSDTKIFDALEVIQVENTQFDPNNIEVQETKTITDELQTSPYKKETFVVLDKWAGYHSESASDAVMLESLGMQGSYIPQWVKKTFGEGVHGGDLEVKDLKIALEYLIKVGIVK